MSGEPDVGDWSGNKHTGEQEGDRVRGSVGEGHEQRIDGRGVEDRLALGRAIARR